MLCPAPKILKASLCLPDKIWSPYMVFKILYNAAPVSLFCLPLSTIPQALAILCYLLIPKHAHSSHPWAFTHNVFSVWMFFLFLIGKNLLFFFILKWKVFFSMKTCDHRHPNNIFIFCLPRTLSCYEHFSHCVKVNWISSFLPERHLGFVI